MEKLKQIHEFLRFAVVGVIATAVHYGLYYILRWFMYVNVAYTVGYLVSFVPTSPSAESPRGERRWGSAAHTCATICCI